MGGYVWLCACVCVPLCRHHVIIAQLRKRQPLLFEWECECECACCERNRKLQAKDVGIYDKSLGNVLLTTHQTERLPPGQCTAQRRIQRQLRRLKQSQLVDSLLLLLFWLQVLATVCSLSLRICRIFNKAHWCDACDSRSPLFVWHCLQLISLMNA